MKKYLLFDLDGTLTASAPGIISSVKEVIRHYGLREYSQEELGKFIGPPLAVSFSKYLGLPDDKILEAIGVYREYFEAHGIFDNSVYDGIPETLQKLKDSGHILAVSTSKPEIYAKTIVDYYKIAPYFTFVCGIPMEDEQMTKAQVIATTLEKLGVTDKNEVLMIGDRFYDVEGADENGIECMGVTFGYGNEEELTQAGAKYIAHTAEEIFDVINGIK